LSFVLYVVAGVGRATGAGAGCDGIFARFSNARIVTLDTQQHAERLDGIMVVIDEEDATARRSHGVLPSYLVLMDELGRGTQRFWGRLSVIISSCMYPRASTVPSNIPSGSRTAEIPWHTA
jgi:hypothetical protein